jgi:collagenase-like PrtC family protease
VRSDGAPFEIVCPAGTPAAFRTAVDAGAHSVYCGFSDETNARNFPGLNFSRAEMCEGIAYAHANDAKVLIAINTFPRAGNLELWHRAVDDAARMQAAAAHARSIDFYVEEFGVRRVVLPRVLSIPEITQINAAVACETEVFVFGGLCVMAEGRCSLSSYATGKSPNMHGVCSPASHVTYREEDGELTSRLGEFTINRVGRGAPVAYPTLCKGRFKTALGCGHIFEEPASLDARHLLPQLNDAGVTALKIEGRQRSRAYTGMVVRAFRAAVDAMARGDPMPEELLVGLTEGQQATSGAYLKTWR